MNRKTVIAYGKVPSIAPGNYTANVILNEILNPESAAINKHTPTPFCQAL